MQYNHKCQQMHGMEHLKISALCSCLSLNRTEVAWQHEVSLTLHFMKNHLAMLMLLCGTDRLILIRAPLGFWSARSQGWEFRQQRFCHVSILWLWRALCVLNKHSLSGMRIITPDYWQARNCYYISHGLYFCVLTALIEPEMHMFSKYLGAISIF